LNFNTVDGLNFTNSKIEYQGYSFRNGLIFLFADFIFWALIGLYLDQVIPSQFGVAKPWYFIC
jgi:hypothetical protein